MLKKILIGLGGLVVLLVAAAFIAPMVMDWNGYKADVAAAAKQATGRDLTISGDIEVRLLPSPALSAKGIAFQNAPGGSEPAMVALEEVTVEVALFPLISGDIQVESVVLTRPVILLETLADGSGNWELTPPDATESSGEGAGAPSVSLDSLRIVDGTVIWRDAAAGEERIEDLDAEISAGSLEGPYALQGTAKVRGLGTTLDLAVGRLEMGTLPPVKLTFGLPDSGATLTLDGRIATGATPGFQGTLVAKGSNLAAALRQLSGSEGLPPLLGQAFELTTHVNVDAVAARAEELTLGLGESRGAGSLVYTLAPAPSLDAKLAFPQLDLDTLLAQAKAPGDAPVAAGEAAAEAPATLLPPGLTGSIELAVGALIYNGQPLQDVTLAADIANDVVTLRDIAMQLPGPSTLQLSGQVALREGAPAFDGQVALRSDKLRSLLGWLGQDLDQVPADRLGRFVFTTQVKASGSQVALSDLALELDSTKASGAVNVALGERLGLGAGLAIDKLNLDAYLPPAGAADGGGGESAGGGLEALKGFDANLDLRIGSLTYQETQVADIRLEGTLANGVMSFKQARLGQVAGGSLSYVGKVAVDGPTLDGTLEVSASDPAKLARLAGLDPATLAPLGPFGLSANLKGTPAKLGFNARLDALGGDFGAAGTVEAANDGPIQLAVTAKHPDLAALAGAFGQGGALPAGFGGIDAEARVTLSGADISVTDLKGQLGPLAIQQATLAYAGGGARPALAADVTAGTIDLAAFAGADGGGKPATGGGERWSKEPLGLEGLRDLDATVKLKAAALVDGETRIENAVVDLVLKDGLLTLNGLTGTMNGGALSANGQVDARPETPTLAAAFQVSNMNLAPFLVGVFPIGEPAGTVSATGQLASAGNSVYGLVDNVDGDIDAGGTFNLKTGGLGTVGGLGLEVGGKVLEGLLGSDAKGLGQVKNVTDGAALLVKALADHDSPFTAQIALRDGVATLERVQINGRGLTAQATGVADLIPFTGDILLSILLNDNPNEPYYQEQRIGLLDDPAEIIRTGLLLAGTAPDDLPDAEAPSIIEELVPGAEGGLPDPQQILEGLTGGAQPGVPDAGGIVGGLTGEQPAAEGTSEPPSEATTEESTTEESAAEQPAEATTEESTTEEPAAEQPAEATTEEATTEEPAAEQPAEATTEQAAEATEEPAAEEPTAEAPAGELAPVLPKLLDEVLQ
jgi:uncharacterized protein involved in outer membrane biogenesis